MLRVNTSIAKVALTDQPQMENLISHLEEKGYFPVIRSMFTGMFKLANVAEPHEQLRADVISRPPYFFRIPEFADTLGDLFFASDRIYVLIPLRENALQASVVGHEEQTETLQEFCHDIEKAMMACSEGITLEWVPPERTPRRAARRRYAPGEYLVYEELVEDQSAREALEPKTTEPNYSADDAEAAKLLVDHDTRQSIISLSQMERAISKDAMAIRDPTTLQRLLALALIAEECLLMCKRDQHTICIVPSEDYLSREPMNSLRCNTCGEPFPREKVQGVYTLKERGKKLIDGSLWMSIWVTELLQASGVKRNGIKWRLEADGEELDLVVEDFSSRLFLELKDREFGLGDAYPFFYRVNRYKGNVGVVATMDKVSSEAKKFFEEEAKQRPEYRIRIQYLEGPQEIEEGITRIIRETALSQVRILIAPFSVRVGFNLWPIIERRLNVGTDAPLTTVR